LKDGLRDPLQKEVAEMSEVEIAVGKRGMPRVVVSLAETAVFAKRIVAAYDKAVGGIVETGKILIEAKAALGHGEWIKMVEHDLPFSLDTVDRFMKIAKHPVLSNSDHWSEFPASWRTLYELARLPEDVLAAKIADRTITPQLERSEVRVLLVEAGVVKEVKSEATAVDRVVEMCRLAEAEAEAKVAKAADPIPTGFPTHYRCQKQGRAAWEAVNDAIDLLLQLNLDVFDKAYRMRKFQQSLLSRVRWDKLDPGIQATVMEHVARAFHRGNSPDVPWQTAERLNPYDGTQCNRRAAEANNRRARLPRREVTKAKPHGGTRRTNNRRPRLRVVK
jgi:hypothetical protein